MTTLARQFLVLVSNTRISSPRRGLLCIGVLLVGLLVGGGVLLAAATGAQAQVFVDARNTSGAEDGTSWATAYPTLTQALAVATGTDEIWIAAGTYAPTSGTDRTASFRVTGAQDGLKIYGGFAGTEGTRDQRDPVSNLTILSGDIGTTGDDSDNSYHVLFLDGTTGTAGPITTATVLDGVTITGGYADGSSGDGVGGGLLCAGAGPGSTCSPSITRVTFRGNEAAGSVGRGGAMYNWGSGGGASSPQITNVAFVDNRALDGGALYNVGSSGVSSPVIVNTSFSNNTATQDGGAIYNNGSRGTSSPTILNAVFIGNSTQNGKGGAMYNDGRFSGGESSPVITNTTFTRNAASSDDGGAIYNRGDGGGTSRPLLTNVILWDDFAFSEGREIFNDEATPTLRHTIVKGGLGFPGIGNMGGGSVIDGGGNQSSDPLFVDADGRDDIAGTSDDDVRLRGGSPALDAGDDNALPAGVTTDVAGNDRIQNGTVDLGAYEGRVDPALILFVDASSMAGTGDGTSWATAYSTLTQALAVATGNDEIWIAAGTYTPTSGTDRTASFRVTGAQDGLKIYGGFNGTEFRREERAPASNGTILNGDIGMVGNARDNSYHVLFFDGTAGGPITSATVLDGVTVTGGHADGTSENRHGGGLYCRGGDNGICSPTLSSLIFTENHAEGGGGALYTDGAGGDSSPNITNALFVGNSGTDGGAIYSHSYQGTSSPTITNATFFGNAAVDRGGAIYNDGSDGNHTTCYSIGYTDGFQDGELTGYDEGYRNGYDVGWDDGYDSAIGSGMGMSGKHKNKSSCNINYDEGYGDGYASGYDSGYDKGYSDGYADGYADGTSYGFAANQLQKSRAGRRSAAHKRAFYATATRSTSATGSTSSPQLTNVILWGNTAGTNGGQIYNDGAGTTLTLGHTLIEGGLAGISENNSSSTIDGGSNLDVAPLFVDSSNPAGSDGRFGTADDGLRLQIESPALNAGDGSALPTGLTTDLMGNPRIQGSAVDLGAYEGGTSGPVVAFVAADGPVSFEGTDVHLDFVGVRGSGNVTVERMGTAPDDLGGLDPEWVNAFRIVIDVEGDLTFGPGTEVRVDVALLGSSADPQMMVIYRRPEPGIGAFVALPTTVDLANNQLVATTGEFSEFVVVNESNPPLPVELAQFTATLDAGRVQLRWATASEQNNGGFHVERAVDDGTFTPLRFVSGQGTASTPSSYRIDDRRLPFEAERLAYRLRQVDLDGTETLSPTVTIAIGAPTRLELHETFPNPAYGAVTVRYELPESGTVRLVVYNLLGQRVRVVGNGPQHAGRVEQRLDMSRLSTGTYFLRLETRWGTRTQRLVVVK